MYNLCHAVQSKGSVSGSGPIFTPMVLRQHTHTHTHSYQYSLGQGQHILNVVLIRHTQ